MVSVPALRPIYQPARRRAGKRQVHVAIEMGLSASFISQLEAGYIPNRPHIQTLVEIAKSVDADAHAILVAVAGALGRSVEDLLAELPEPLREEFAEATPAVA